MYGLNIHIKSIQINKKIVQKNDKIRITVSVFPNSNSDTISLDGSNLINADHTFTVNVTEQTKKLVFVFEKKCLFQNYQMIASTDLNLKDIPKSLLDIENTEERTISIYEPILYQNNRCNTQLRQIFGQITFQFSLTDVKYHSKSNLNQLITNKIYKKQGYSKINSHHYKIENQNNLNCEYAFI